MFYRQSDRVILTAQPARPRLWLLHQTSIVCVATSANNESVTERRFYCEQLGMGHLTLAESEAHHARDVLRLREGDLVHLFDGRGGEATARIEAINRKTVTVYVEQIEAAGREEERVPVTMAVAMPKGARQDVLIEKCTELGAEAIWPLMTRRCVVRPGKGRVEHWRKVAIAAAKQSRRVCLPTIVEPMAFKESQARIPDFAAALVGSTDPAAASLVDTLSGWQPGGKILLVIGPEGGWEAEEEASLVKAGARPFSLSRSVLRTETAAIAALAVTGAWLARMSNPRQAS